MAEKVAKVLNKMTDAKKKDNPPILKYVKNHIRDLFHFPMAVLVKGAAILTEELFIESLPAAWELLLESNQVHINKL